MSIPVQQLPLRLPHRPQMTRADFLVGAANAHALALIETWPNWTTSTVILTGPAGAGKSHLVEIWRARSAASIIAASDVDDGRLGNLNDTRAVAVEDIHMRPLREQALFHLLNLAKEQGVSLLLTSRVPIADLKVGLPDLASRLMSAQQAELGPPDDALLRAVLVKLFADRQLEVDAGLIEYVLRRMERSLEAANALVAHLDREALAGGVPVSRRLVSRALGEPFADSPDRGPEREMSGKRIS